MSLPIIRLRAVDVNHATVATDPLAASCTLYTFLRSVPTRFDCEMAMGDFKQSLQSPAGATFLSATNTRMLALVSSCVHDRLLQRPPAVVPLLARRASTWRALLRGEAARREQKDGAPADAQKTQLDRSKDGLMPSSSTFFSSSSFTGECVDRSAASVDDEAKGPVVVKEFVSTEASRFKSPYEQATPNDYLPACDNEHANTVVVAKEATESGGGGDGEKKSSDQFFSAEKPLPLGDNMNYSRIGYRPHPLLLSILDNIRSSISAEENEDDREEREFVTMMESKAAALRTKLLSSLSMIPPEEKSALEFVRQMELRFGLAEKLFEVQKYEEETIQITQAALMIEIAAMRALFHKVIDAVAEAEERHKQEGPRSPFYVEECRVMAAIQEALDELPS